jgi:hypothetical protein
LHAFCMAEIDNGPIVGHVLFGGERGINAYAALRRSARPSSACRTCG